MLGGYGTAGWKVFPGRETGTSPGFQQTCLRPGKDFCWSAGTTPYVLTGERSGCQSSSGALKTLSPTAAVSLVVGDCCLFAERP